MDTSMDSSNNKKWQQFVTSLPAWEQELLHNSEECEDTETTFAHQLKQRRNKLTLVTDGGAKGKLGSFGWVIGTWDKVICKGRGYAKGYPMDSHRAEGIGRLAGLLFFKRYCEFKDIRKGTTRIASYCDNKDAVRLGQPTVNPWYSPNTTMRPNWDAYSQAHTIQTEISKIVKIDPCLHVKAHQDKEKPFEELEWPAKLNYWADAEATKALKEFRSKEQHVWHPFPMCTAYLEVNGRICMAKNIKLLDEWVNEQPLHAYYKKRNKWNTTTLHSIDWDAFRGARKQFQYNDIAFCTKLCCRWLSTNAKQVQIKEATIDTCLSCNQAETNAHLFQCNSRSAWKQEFIGGLRKLLSKNKTETKIQDAMVAGLDAWLDQRKNTHTLDHQKEIGWHQCFLGFLSAKWGQQQQEHYNKLGEEKLTARTWGMKIIQYLWVQAKKAWKIRNDKAHDDNDLEAKSRYREELERKVRHLYKYENQLSASDRDILAEPIEVRLKDKTYALENWYEETRVLIQDCVRDFNAITEKGLQDIRNFLTRKK
jgi:hypothetical protein